MRKYILLILFALQSSFIFAQLQSNSFKNDELNLKLELSNNHFFYFQNLNGLIKEYVRGEWKIDGNKLILTESYHSEKAENKHSIRKAPKFDYTTAKRETIYTISGDNLIFFSQKTEPVQAKFEYQLFGNFKSEK